MSFLSPCLFLLQDVTGEENREENIGMNLMEFSDEILLHILRYIPVSDLVLNVRSVCRKLSTLSLDKSLTHTVMLHKDYQVSRGCRRRSRIRTTLDEPGVLKILSFTQRVSLGRTGTLQQEETEDTILKSSSFELSYGLRMGEIILSSFFFKKDIREKISLL